MENVNYKIGDLITPKNSALYAVMLYDEQLITETNKKYTIDYIVNNFNKNIIFANKNDIFLVLDMNVNHKLTKFITLKVLFKNKIYFASPSNFIKFPIQK